MRWASRSSPAGAHSLSCLHTYIPNLHTRVPTSLHSSSYWNWWYIIGIGGFVQSSLSRSCQCRWRLPLASRVHSRNLWQIALDWVLSNGHAVADSYVS